MRILWMKRDMKEAIDWGRVHHQLQPDILYAETIVANVSLSVFWCVFLSCNSSPSAAVLRKTIISYS